MTTTSYRFGDAQLQPAQRSLLVGGKDSRIGARAFDLLLALVWPGLVVEARTLAQALRGSFEDGVWLVERDPVNAQLHERLMQALPRDELARSMQAGAALSDETALRLALREQGVST
jgi:hypothetical protein